MEGTTRSAVARATKRKRKRREGGRGDAEAPLQFFLGGSMAAE